MFTLNGYKIVFRRRWQNKCTDFNGKYLLGDGRYDTVCEIYIRDIKFPSYTGIAKLHPNDRPDKIVGKKIALRNAMKEYRHVFDKGIRTVIWKAFFAWVESWNNQPNNIVTK